MSCWRSSLEAVDLGSAHIEVFQCSRVYVAAPFFAELAIEAGHLLCGL
jgi:hypothetical protein